jgi:hypothetical protein
MAEVRSLLRGELHVPHYIFMRCAGRVSDRALLDLFGLESYRPVAAARQYNRYAILGDDGEWTLLADDWGYTLWNRNSTVQAVHQIAQSCDVFTCWVGDADCSFGFAYYRDGQAVRRYTVEDPNPHRPDRTVTENIGEPLPGEAAALRERDEVAVVLTIAASLGIRADYALRDVRVYAPVRPA